MKRIIIVLLVLVLTGQTRAQKNDSPAGILQLGVRSTWSLFGTDGYSGEGVGGQFRLRLHERVNTEWFADYITNNIHDVGKRIDGHIGWSVMFYPYLPEKQTFLPYILAGHCFDYTSIRAGSSYFVHNPEFARRWSSAAQIGVGTHLNLASFADLSFSMQYMIHFGTDLHVHVHDHGGYKEMHISNAKGHGGFEGHVFLTLGLNLKIADLW